MTNIIDRLKNNIKFYKLEHNKHIRQFKRVAKKTDVYGCFDLLRLIDAKLAVVEHSYENWDMYVDQDYDLRNIKILRSLINNYLEKDFMAWVADEKDPTHFHTVSKVHINPRTAWKFAKEMCPTNEKAQKYLVEHPYEIYEYKLNRLIWNILKDHYLDFCL